MKKLDNFIKTSIVEYILTSQSLGHNKNKIKRKLRKIGFSKIVIEEGIISAKKIKIKPVTDKKDIKKEETKELKEEKKLVKIEKEEEKSEKQEKKEKKEVKKEKPKLSRKEKKKLRSQEKIKRKEEKYKVKEKKKQEKVKKKKENKKQPKEEEKKEIKKEKPKLSRKEKKKLKIQEKVKRKEEKNKIKEKKKQEKVEKKKGNKKQPKDKEKKKVKKEKPKLSRKEKKKLKIQEKIKRKEEKDKIKEKKKKERLRLKKEHKEAKKRQKEHPNKEKYKPKTTKEIQENKKGGLYFILFLLSILLFSYGFISRNILALTGAIILMFYSLIAYKASKIIKIRKEEVEKKEVTKIIPKHIQIAKGKYETDIDIFYKLVEQHGPITISAIAKHFKMDKKKIEEWADILEEEEMVRIHYPPIGDAEITKW